MTKVLFAERIEAIADTKSVRHQIPSSITNKETQNMSSNAFNMIRASVDEARKNGINVVYVDRMLARAGVQVEIGHDKKISLAKLDKAMGASNMNMDERVRIKNTLFNLDLLAR